MAKQRPTLETFAQPTSQLVTPVEAKANPLNEQAIRDTYAFADSFSELSQTVGQFAVQMKKDQKEEDLRLGQELVNANRKTYGDLVRSGKINPSENPWMAIGAQVASGVLEASRAKADFQQEYDRRVQEDPSLLKDNQFFDALAASFAQNKDAEFGTTTYLKDSFYAAFNPYLTDMNLKHGSNVAKYRQGQITLSLRVKVDEALAGLDAPNFGLREDGTQKDVGFEGVLYDAEGNAVTEKSTTVSFADGGEVSIPMLVPGLSLEAREAIVYNAAELKDLPERDQNTILDHALARMREDKSPFYNQTEAVLPALQAFMDEMGQNMGMPRTANLATAARLIEAMKASGTTYRAEELLKGLTGGTGPLVGTEEVKAMLSEAQPDIQTTRFEMAKNQEKSVANLLIQKAFNMAYEGGGSEVGYEESYAALNTFLDGTEALTIEERGKFVDTFNEKWNAGVREGQETLNRQDIKGIRRLFAEDLAKIAANARGSVLDWGAAAKALDSHIRVFDGASNPEVAKKARAAVHDFVNTKLGETEVRLIEELNNRAVELGFTKGSITSLAAEPEDEQGRNGAKGAKALRDLKEAFRGRMKMNELQAAIHFGMEDRLEGIRAIAINGISADVELGLRADLVDLVNAWRSSAGGRSPLSALLQAGKAGERTERFLVATSLKMDMGMTMENAVRDAAVETNMVTSMHPGEFINLKPDSPELLEVGKYAASTYREFRDSWWPAGFGEADPNPDSITGFNSMFTRKYLEVLMDSQGSHEAALEAAIDYVRSNTAYIRHSFVMKSDMPANVDEAYVVNAIDLLVNNPAVEAPALVLVEFGANGQGVYALRDRKGNALNYEYYTMADLTSNEKPRDEDGNLIPGGLSMFERVVQRRASENASKRGSMVPSIYELPNRLYEQKKQELKNSARWWMDTLLTPRAGN